MLVSISLIWANATSATAAASGSTHQIPWNSSASGLTLLCSDGGYACTGGGYNGTAGQIGGNGWATWQYWNWGSGGTNRHNCTTYAAYRLQVNGYAYPGWTANANDWDAQAQGHGTLVDQTPAVGSIAQWNGGGYGHVAYVEVVTDAYIQTSADNYGGGTNSHRIARSSAYMPDNFIHFKDLASPPPSGGDPFGSIDGAMGLLGGGAFVRGWVLDPDTTSPIEMHVYVDGGPGSGARGVSLGLAQLYRPDVDAVHHKGAYHGFSTGFTGLPAGNHTLYFYGINVNGTPGGNPLVGQAAITVPAAAGGTPLGNGDSARGDLGGIAVAGWAFDPDAPTSPVEIHAYLDGPAGAEYRGFNLGLAQSPRPDVPAVHPGVGNNHGFDTTLGTIAPGPHTLFVYAINRVGGGDNPIIGILGASVPSGDPVGGFDLAADAVRSVRLTGWAADPDDPTNPVTIHAYLDGPAGTGRGRDLGAASLARADVGAAHPGAGPNHGFDAVYPDVSPGQHTIHIYALNRAAPGNNVLLGSRTVTVTAPPPAASPPTAPAPTAPAAAPPTQPAPSIQQPVPGTQQPSVAAPSAQAVPPGAVASASVAFPRKRTATLVWSAPTGASGYLVRISKRNSTKKYSGWIRVASPTATFTKLKKKATYRIQVTPTGPGGNGPTATFKFKQKK